MHSMELERWGSLWKFMPDFCHAMVCVSVARIFASLLIIRSSLGSYVAERGLWYELKQTVWEYLINDQPIAIGHWTLERDWRGRSR